MAIATKNWSDQIELTAKLSQLARSDNRLISFTESIEFINPLGFFANGRRLTGTAFYWARPGENLVRVGAGTAITFKGHGSTRFQQVAAAWRNLTQNYQPDHSSPVGVGPTLMGGFAFDPQQQPKSPLWQTFGDGSMTLPQFQLTCLGGQTFLTYNLVLPTEFETMSAAHRTALFEHYAENVVRLKTTLLRPATAPLAVQTTNEQPPYRDVLPAEAWQKIVANATHQIRQGAFQKTVLAREVVACFEQPLETEATLQRLSENFPTATVFAIAQREKSFLGATPERLLQLEKGVVRTAALAGSAPRSPEPLEDWRIGEELLNSSKNREEHALVVNMIVEKLQNVCDPLDVPTVPRLLKLANVQHLYTPIEGCLRGEAGLLELIASLHPTPALGGYPRQAALDFIRQHEQLDRGWYAAPIGWVNTRGEGEFAVAIRSALINGNEAHLFAGCGIVADSDPASEYQESRIKLQAIAKSL